MPWQFPLLTSTIRWVHTIDTSAGPTSTRLGASVTAVCFLVFCTSRSLPRSLPLSCYVAFLFCPVLIFIQATIAVLPATGCYFTTFAHSICFEPNEQTHCRVRRSWSLKCPFFLGSSRAARALGRMSREETRMGLTRLGVAMSTELAARGHSNHRHVYLLFLLFVHADERGRHHRGRTSRRAGRGMIVL